jgi:FlaA1/EpsC-like NDP-sugar epimerase
MYKTLQDIVFKLLGKRYLPLWVILLIDLTIVGIAFVFSVLLLSDFDFDLLYSKDRLLTWSILELCFGVSFLLYKSYEGAFRHTGVRDLIRLVLAALTSISLAFFCI